MLQTKASLEHLTAEVLRDLARNGSAAPEMRKAAVELLVDGGYAHADHPELALLASQVRSERAAVQEVKEIVATAVEADPFSPETGQEETAPMDLAGEEELPSLYVDKTKPADESNLQEVEVYGPDEKLPADFFTPAKIDAMRANDVTEA